MKLHVGSTPKVFEVPHPVRVTADLYGELKGLLGPQCLG
jgi:DNA polymerase-3 subunit alpha